VRVLLTNDDGIQAPGLRGLYRVLSRRAAVSVCAPAGQRSGVAHSLSLLAPIRVEEVREDGSLWGYAVEGSPVDCVRLALMEGLSPRPNAVVSGINLGSNTGVDTFYSGTVAAALEAGLLGVPAMAVSVAHTTSPDYDTAADIACRLLDVLLELGGPRPPVLNVNIPALPPGRIRGIRVTRQGRHGGRESYERRTDPRGRPYFWIRPGDDRVTERDDEDARALREGYVSVTPLGYDLTDRRTHDRLRRMDLRLLGSDSPPEEEP